MLKQHEVIRVVKFKKLMISDGTWQEVCADWRRQCENAGEDFELFERVRMEELRRQAESGIRGGVHVLDLKDYPVMCFLNHTPIPGRKDPILRMRHMTVCPALDYGIDDDDDSEHYIELLTNLFEALVEISTNDLPTDHFRMHLRSPAEMVFFDRLGSHIDESKGTLKAKKRGAWLYVDKV